jgi:hypothetical protein
VNTAEPGKSIRSEKEEDGYKFHAEDLLMPIPQSVSLLAQLMSLSIQNLDTAFRGSLRIQSPIVQYPHSFRTTLLQISQKLNNAFLVSSTNADKIKMHSLFVPSKVKEAKGYLEKSTNSSRMAEFLHLPLKNLKETTDQTYNLSSQIANHFGELVQLVDEVIQSHNFSMSTKERQVRNTSVELHRERQEKKRTEIEILSIEKEIENLKEQRQSDESAFHYALEDLKQLQSKETDESQCYWRYNWDWDRTYTRICPHHPDPSQIRQLNQTAKTAQKKLEKTMRSLYAKEEEAAKEREVDNELKIRIERLNHELHQLREDVQLLGNISDPLRLLRISFKKLDKSWKNFVVICENLQSGATKSLDVIQEANRTSTLWNNQLSESILLNLNKTNEDLSLVKSVIDIYLEGSNIEIIREIVTEVEQMLTMRENIKEEKRILAKCGEASGEIKNLLERNQRLTCKRSSPNKRIYLLDVSFQI